jgi:hypothetical protein
MKKLSSLLLVLSALLMFNGCSNDVDINASYQEITVVYGLLDTNQDTTYLKINKAFLGDDNALIMAQIPDSSEFIEKLDVKIWEDGNESNTYTFDTITIHNKEAGVFYNPNQIIYYSAFKPEVDKTYKLRVLYKNNEVSSETTTFSFVKDDIVTPNNNKKIGFVNNNLSKVVAWNRQNESPRYDILIRFHFKEVWENSADTVYRQIDFHSATVKSVAGPEGESFYTGAQFFNSLATYCPYPDQGTEEKVLERYTSTVEYYVAAGGLELNAYMEVNEPSSSIIQDRPDYTNITNGVGIFSCRGVAMKSKKLNDQTVAIIKDQYYYLRFQY